MTRFALLLTLAAAPAFCQSFTWGVKAGVPFTDAFKAVKNQNLGYVSDTKRYTFGPTVELSLPFGFNVELDALYRRLEFEESTAGAGGAVVTRSVKSNIWDFPLLLKWKAGVRPVQPFATLGPTFRTLSNLRQAGSFFTGSRDDDPPELKHRFSTGFTAGLGLRIGGKAAISPEVRYTRWGWKTFSSVGGLLKSNSGQLEALVGLTF